MGVVIDNPFLAFYGKATGRISEGISGKVLEVGKP